MKLTHSRKSALLRLKHRHDDYPNASSFLACHLGRNTSALLRKMEPDGFVKLDKIADNAFRYSLTDAGREALK